MFFLLFIVFGLLLGWFNWSLGLRSGFRLVFSVLGVGVVLLRPALPTALDIEEVLSVLFRMMFMFLLLMSLKVLILLIVVFWIGF